MTFNWNKVSRHKMNDFLESIDALKPIKPTEQGRVNPAYYHLRDLNPNAFVPTVPYIWVITEKREVVIGIEAPWDYPDAFGFNIENPEDAKNWTHIQQQLKEAQPILGHPTIAVQFLETRADAGTTLPGKCYIGGDLFHDGENWILNNRSGRYGRKDEHTVYRQQQVESYLRFATHLFKQISMPVTPKLYFHKRNPDFTSDIFAGDTSDLDSTHKHPLRLC